MTKSVAESFMEARDLILGDEGAREAAVYKYGARSMSTKDQNSKEYRFESFVGILLSPMVTDPINWRVVQRLKANLPGGLTAQSIKDATEDEIYRLMSDMNFNKRKSKNLKLIGTKFADEYDGDIPQDYAELLKLPGVGMKVGKLIMEVCWNRGFGIPIDTHGHRVANRVGWVQTNQPDKTAIELESLIPAESYHLVNEPLVALGQSYCTAKNPRCSTCPIAHLCKYISHPTNSTKASDPSSSSSIPSIKNVTSVKKPKIENKSIQGAASTVKRRSDESSSLSHPPTFKSRKHVIVVPQV